MKRFSWNPEKNLILKSDPARRICFEDIVTAIEAGGLLDDLEHINPRKYPGQRLLAVLVDGYVYGVPYVLDGDEVFLKTVYPSRRLTAIYLKG